MLSIGEISGFSLRLMGFVIKVLVSEPLDSFENYWAYLEVNER